MSAETPSASGFYAAFEPRTTSRWDAAFETRTPSTGVVRSPRPLTSGSPQARLVGLLRTVEGAREGQRNHILFWAACKVGEMIRDGEIQHAREIARSLATLAQENGLAPNETERTIASAFRASGVAP